MPGTSWKNSNHMDWIQQLGIMQGAMAEERFPQWYIAAFNAAELQKLHDCATRNNENHAIIYFSSFNITSDFCRPVEFFTSTLDWWAG